jgi:ethanolamine utilization cobalamin adenosyltransferase
MSTWVIGINISQKRIVRQVGHLQELNRDPWSTIHKILLVFNSMKHVLLHGMTNMKINFRRREVRAVVNMPINFVHGITVWKTMNFKLIRCDILMALNIPVCKRP